jgi:glycosyltransferase involved in cell wall biosynthesis
MFCYSGLIQLIPASLRRLKVLFTVVTPSFNCGDFILDNIESVRSQGLKSDELEHWIIDGGSTDSTIEVLRVQKGVHWISEPDQGLSDAVNKGIQRAKGEWIIWLNADDLLAKDACKMFLEYAARHPDVRVFAGDLTVLRYDGTEEQTIKGWDYNLEDLLGCRTGINQASTFIHRSVYEKIGLLDVSNRYAMDYEWMVRAMHHYRCVPIPRVLTYYRRRKGSITDANLVKQFHEFIRIRRLYGKSRLSMGEFRNRFYIYTDWLRRVFWVRCSVRRIKRLFGREPMHPH